METLIAACAAFLGTHFLLSHPLRKPLVDAVGERIFLGLYSLVAFATLGWMVHAYGRIPDEAPLWAVGDALWAAASAIMLLASVLLVGSLIGNPALPDPTGRPKAVPRPRGVFAITRHPMMWSFALWALVHILVFPQPAQIVLATSIGLLALVGAKFQDDKKRKLQPDFWPRWQGVTSYWPFVAIAQGRAQGAAAWPGRIAVVGGTILWLAASWAHLPLAQMPAGIWRWING
ncbi:MULTISPECIES: NnrU family protein [unclassified Sphingomonas]|uniref:NnrU family protein n=1 Tax=unclassified Sphingomonas TaxID=196159 RepID=UPI0021519050|nr:MULTISPECIES: NnrU family protein [unclassified Sphingomonas]MCR5871437.1 NnrU family protein [Sphingomonas sp. J344]UUY00264.1 NnrU family protein [Sphingomonas sp. J315]